jgi:hypothetical protein
MLASVSLAPSRDTLNRAAAASNNLGVEIQQNAADRPQATRYLKFAGCAAITSAANSC